ncbi:transposase [Ktedonobacteria bacterium brp13]|nr:transposase [Ktedonobacteria bacterium brp13]
MSYQSKRELLWQMVPRYREASSALKEVILDEFVAATGYARKYAIRLLNHPAEQKRTITRPRAAHYGPEVQQALYLAWTVANHICAKRLVPFLPTLVASLEQHGHLHLSERGRAELLAMSPATADRILQPYRRQGKHGIATTRSGTLLKKQIPIRTFQDWSETRPGFMEADLVAHCGTQTDGSYLSTLTLTDIATGWTEMLPLLNRNQEDVMAALKRVRQLLPFPLLGLDTDNGGEFINMELLAYCEQEQITFTRGRPKRSNDQCYIEQKNGHIVRQIVGYDRFAGEFSYRQLTELYRALRVYINCFQPSMKLQEKQRDGEKVHKKYDRAQTPMQRLLATKSLSKKKGEELTRITQALDPLRLLQQLEQLQKALFRHALALGREAEQNEASAFQSFSARQCAEESIPHEGIPGTPPALLKKEQKRRSQRSGRPHDWRTRKDPFEGTWDDITNWLRVQPDLTGTEIFHTLQHLYPGRYRPTLDQPSSEPCRAGSQQAAHSSSRHL